jgi:hypothetical protein
VGVDIIVGTMSPTAGTGTIEMAANWRRPRTLLEKYRVNTLGFPIGE